MTIIILKSIVIWFVFILVESLNGTARIFWLVPLLGDSLARQVSFAIGSVLVLTIATLFIRWLHAWLMLSPFIAAKIRRVSLQVSD